MCKKLGYITAEDLDWALHRVRRKLGKILIEMGVLKDEELQQALTLQTELLSR